MVVFERNPDTVHAELREHVLWRHPLLPIAIDRPPQRVDDYCGGEARVWPDADAIAHVAVAVKSTPQMLIPASHPSAPGRCVGVKYCYAQARKSRVGSSDELHSTHAVGPVYVDFCFILFGLFARFILFGSKEVSPSLTLPGSPPSLPLGTRSRAPSVAFASAAARTL